MLLCCVSGAACRAQPLNEQPVAGCELPPLGDLAKPIEMKLCAMDPSKVAQDIQDGGTIANIVPPQGGWVVFAGARATNIDPCEVQLKGVLRDTTSGQVSVDERTVNLKAASGGWGGPIDGDISTVSNIYTCPNQWASTDIADNTFELTVSLRDRQNRTASKTIKVVPECAEPHVKASCQCQCTKGYKLGDVCKPK
jgi:hypothetical protein